MKGNNTLYLNEATMIEALQAWIDSKYAHMPPVVTKVQQMSDCGYEATRGSFEVRLAEHGTALS